MKKLKYVFSINILILTLFNSTVFSQTHLINKNEYEINYPINFKFDLLTNYVVIVNNKKKQEIIYSNSKDDNYLLKINGSGKRHRATLYDFKKSVIHSFKVIHKVKKEFKYQHSTNYFNNKINYSFEELESNIKYKKIKVLVSENSKITWQIITLENSEHNFFSIYRVSCLHPYEKFDKIKYPGNYIVTSGIGKTKGGFDIKTKLLTVKSSKLEINIPK